MPYIKKEQRDDLAELTEMIREGYVRDAGELNYLITTLVHTYLETYKQQYGKDSYARFNDAIGALECAKMELYRRKIIPYENEKIKENGDV